MQTQSDAGGFCTAMPATSLAAGIKPFPVCGDGMTITFNYCDLMYLMCIQ